MLNGSYLPPWVLQLLGALLLVGFAVFWAFTNRVEPLFLASAGGLLSLGEASRAAQGLRERGERRSEQAREETDA